MSNKIKVLILKALSYSRSPITEVTSVLSGRSHDRGLLGESRNYPEISTCWGGAGLDGQNVRDHRVNSFKINALIFDILPYEFVSHCFYYVINF